MCVRKRIRDPAHAGAPAHVLEGARGRMHARACVGVCARAHVRARVRARTHVPACQHPSALSHPRSCARSDLNRAHPSTSEPNRVHQPTAVPVAMGAHRNYANTLTSPSPAARALQPVLAHLNTWAPVVGCSVNPDRREGRRRHFKCGSPRDAGGVPPGLVSEGVSPQFRFRGGCPLRADTGMHFGNNFSEYPYSIWKHPKNAYRGVSPQGAFKGGVPPGRILVEGVYPQGGL